MNHFKSQDFKEILFPVHNLKKGMDLFKAFPTLNKYEEFTKAKLPATLPLVKVFKYIVFTYDKKSPYYTQIDEQRERKIEAIKAAGFLPNHKNGFSDAVRGVLSCENQIVNAMIIRYCRLQGKEFTNLIASQEAYYQNNLQLISNIKSDDDDAIKFSTDKAKLDEQITKQGDRLNEKARAFLAQEEMSGLYDDLWEIAEEEAQNIKLTPEDYAEAEVQES
jgi:hypothetical protein